MTTVVTLTAFGLIVLGILVWWAKTATVTLEQVAGEEDEAADVQALLSSLDLDLPPHEVILRLTSVEDWKFVQKYAQPEIQKIFLRDRKKILFAAVRDVRSAVGRLFQVHKIIVRYNRDISFAGEIGLLIRYMRFLVVYRSLVVALYLVDPVRVRSGAVTVSGAARGLIFEYGRFLRTMNAEQIAEIKQTMSPVTPGH